MSRFPYFFRQSQQLWTPQLYRQHHSNFSTLPDGKFLHTVCHLLLHLPPLRSTKRIPPAGAEDHKEPWSYSTAAHCYTFLGFRCSSSCIHDDILQKQQIRDIICDVAVVIVVVVEESVVVPEVPWSWWRCVGWVYYFPLKCKICTQFSPLEMMWKHFHKNLHKWKLIWMSGN